MKKNKIFINEFVLPIGKIFILSVQNGLVSISFSKNEIEIMVKKYFEDFEVGKDNTLNKKTISMLKEYFDKKIKYFDIPLLLFGTDFQKKVWAELLKIPFGTTISYKELSNRVGIKKGFQAVGQANGKNPIPIIIPCHRVITYDRKLGGYSGGIGKKKFLLALEGVNL